MPRVIWSMPRPTEDGNPSRWMMRTQSLISLKRLITLDGGLVLVTLPHLPTGRAAGGSLISISQALAAMDTYP